MDGAGEPFVPARGMLRVRLAAELLGARHRALFVWRIGEGRVWLVNAIGVQPDGVLGGAHDVARQREAPN